MPEFNRRYILLSVLVSIALIAAAFFALELGRSKAMTYVQDSQRSLERVQLVVEIQSLLARAESGQRDYIFIGDKSYLESYDHTKLGIADYLTKVRSVYGLPANAAIQPLATKLDELAATKLSELDATIALHHQDTQQAIALMRTHAAQRTMDLLQGVAAQMRSREEALLFATNDAWARANKVNRAISTAGVLLNICLILLAGYLVYRDMQRRTTLATDLEEQVKRQTRDLSALSTHLQRISETERSSLARELHDELGGLLVAIKMDLSQLRTKVDLQQPDIKKRWDHVQTLLSSG
ncbi:MAG: CHASE3 domain-containing protein, partial [Candidatus Obscuribacterales bacterium]|nr:CHASE3 domain-containing protein [Steroidobacteraceae bacterium]